MAAEMASVAANANQRPRPVANESPLTDSTLLPCSAWCGKAVNDRGVAGRIAGAVAGHVDAVGSAELLEDDGHRGRRAGSSYRGVPIVGKCGRIHNSHRVVVADLRCAWGIARIDDGRVQRQPATAVDNLEAAILICEVGRIGYGLRGPSARKQQCR